MKNGTLRRILDGKKLPFFMRSCNASFLRLLFSSLSEFLNSIAHITGVMRSVRGHLLNIVIIFHNGMIVRRGASSRYVINLKREK